MSQCFYKKHCIFYSIQATCITFSFAFLYCGKEQDNFVELVISASVIIAHVFHPKDTVNPSKYPIWTKSLNKFHVLIKLPYSMIIALSNKNLVFGNECISHWIIELASNISIRHNRLPPLSIAIKYLNSVITKITQINIALLVSEIKIWTIELPIITSFWSKLGYEFKHWHRVFSIFFKLLFFIGN